MDELILNLSVFAVGLLAVPHHEEGPFLEDLKGFIPSITEMRIECGSFRRHPHGDLVLFAVANPFGVEMLDFLEDAFSGQHAVTLHHCGMWSAQQFHDRFEDIGGEFGARHHRAQIVHDLRTEVAVEVTLQFQERVPREPRSGDIVEFAVGRSRSAPSSSGSE